MASQPSTQHADCAGPSVLRLGADGEHHARRVRLALVEARLPLNHNRVFVTNVISMAQVDVIIPAYNPGPYLRSTLDSVIAQSLPDWNAVVIDDGSTEDLTWVDSFDHRVRRLRQANAGLSAARNIGIEQGTSRFVAFLDADDIWLPDKLSEQLAALENSDAVLCSTAFDMIDSTGEWLGPGYEGHAASYAELLAANGICVSTVMVPRAALNRVGLFSSAYQQVQDSTGSVAAPFARQEPDNQAREEAGEVSSTRRQHEPQLSHDVS